MEVPLTDAGIMSSDWLNQYALNIYHDGSEGIKQHFDDSKRFMRPIYSIRLFSASRLAFGAKGFAMSNCQFFVPMARGCVTVLGPGYASDGVKHCVRACDMSGKSAALLLRRVYPYLVEEANQILKEDRLREDQIKKASFNPKPFIHHGESILATLPMVGIPFQQMEDLLVARKRNLDIISIPIVQSNPPIFPPPANSLTQIHFIPSPPQPVQSPVSSQPNKDQHLPESSSVPTQTKVPKTPKAPKMPHVGQQSQWQKAAQPHPPKTNPLLQNIPLQNRSASIPPKGTVPLAIPLATSHPYFTFNPKAWQALMQSPLQSQLQAVLQSQRHIQQPPFFPFKPAISPTTSSSPHFKPISVPQGKWRYSTTLIWNKVAIQTKVSHTLVVKVHL